MARETKVGLLIGLALILLVGIILSDLITGTGPKAANANAMTGFGPEAQTGIYSASPDARPAPADPFEQSSAFQQQDTFDYNAFESLPEPEQAEPTPQHERIAPAAPAPRPELPELDMLEARDNKPVLAELPSAWRVTEGRASNGNGTADYEPSVINSSPPPQAMLAAEAFSQIPDVPSSDRVHYVQAGESLADIARRYYNTPEFGQAISLANPGQIDAERRVRAGTRLVIPPLESAIFSNLFKPVHAQHAVQVDNALPELPRRATQSKTMPTEIVVEPGETLSGLAARHLGSAKKWNLLLEANKGRLDRAEDLRSGMKLIIPDAPPAENRVATEPQNDRPAASPRPAAQAKTYTVQPGDSLILIARKQLGDGDLWDALLAANTDVLTDPKQLQAGMTLKLPTATSDGTAEASAPSAPPRSRPAAQAKTYTVQPGDSLSRIAARELGDIDRWDELFELNRDTLDSPDAVVVGQTLRLP